MNTAQKSRVAKWEEPLHEFSETSNSTQKENSSKNKQQDIESTVTRISSDSSKQLDNNKPIVRSEKAKKMLAGLDENQ